jgi:hypothetical protein
MQRNDLAGGRIPSDPDPWLVGLFLHEAPHCIGFGFQAGYRDLSGAGWGLRMHVIGAGRNAFDQKV